jgi:hypothetical protein
MDEALIRFRQAADRENGRRLLRRRYSSTLQQQAVEYWQQHRGEEGVRTIAASLGVSVTTLQRWTRALASRPRFRPIEIMDRAPSVETGTTVVIQITAVGPRIEGLTVETTLRQISLLLERENHRLITKTLQLTAELARVRGLPNPEQLALAALRALEQRRAALLAPSTDTSPAKPARRRGPAMGHARNPPCRSWISATSCRRISVPVPHVAASSPR